MEQSIWPHFLDHLVFIDGYRSNPRHHPISHIITAVLLLCMGPLVDRIGSGVRVIASFAQILRRVLCKGAYDLGGLSGSWPRTIHFALVQRWRTRCLPDGPMRSPDSDLMTFCRITRRCQQTRWRWYLNRFSCACSKHNYRLVTSRCYWQRK